MSLSRRFRCVIAATGALATVVALVGRAHTHASAQVSTRAPVVFLAEGGPLAPPTRVDFVSRGNTLTGFLFSPHRPGPAPLLVYNHGSEDDPDLKWLGDVGRFYQSHGFAVFFPWRQGCSGSGGMHWLVRFPMVGDELDPVAVEERTIRALEDELVDVRAAVDFGRTLPGVDATHVYLGGSSFGGVLALMGAGAIPQIEGAVACSGAAWTYKGNTPGGQKRLEALARDAQAPIFFMQAANDYNQGSSEALGGIMSQAGLPHVARVYPRYGSTAFDGHAGFCNHGSALWGADVLAYLNGD